MQGLYYDGSNNIGFHSKAVTPYAIILLTFSADRKSKIEDADFTLP